MLSVKDKYKKGYFFPPQKDFSWIKKDSVEKPPIWCSVDLRDGNQALKVPMTIEEKLVFFKMLVHIGFKEIEIGFPASNETEFNFARLLIENDLIPDDVTIQVLTLAREDSIKRTFQAVEGAKNAIIHFYNSISKSQREQVFKKSKEEIKKIAVDGAKFLLKYKENTKGNFKFEYSPESFSGAEPEYSLEVCNAVLDELSPSAKNKVIINIPSTIELSMPHIFASQVAYISKNLKHRKNVILSVHPHNDRGCAVVDAEMAVLAGCQRVEGTLFGNGERSGNVDLVTLALNLHMHGVDSQLNFKNLPKIVRTYEKITKLKVPIRSPYAGRLVFTAFSGSHQDAISKGLNYRKKNKGIEWNVPYLPIDPKDIGRNYNKGIIRINSQSGKGGIFYIICNKFKTNIPDEVRKEFSVYIKNLADSLRKELTSKEVVTEFVRKYHSLSGI